MVLLRRQYIILIVVICAILTALNLQYGLSRVVKSLNKKSKLTLLSPPDTLENQYLKIPAVTQDLGIATYTTEIIKANRFDPYPTIVKPAGMKSILYWSKVYGRNPVPEPYIRKCNEWKCYISSSVKLKYPSLSFDALIFHQATRTGAPKFRSPKQIYIADSNQPPTHLRDRYLIGNFYNWSLTYMRKSEAYVPYGTFEPGQARLQIQDLYTRKTNHSSGAHTAIIMSNCRAVSRRQLYMKELNRYTPVHGFGKCMKRKCTTLGYTDECFKYLAHMGYRFYLAFENSACEDYITEKPFYAMRWGFIPIVMGGTSKADYERLLPPDSYLDVRNFTSAKNLADYLNVLIQDDEKYFKYHAWRRKFKVARTDPLCKVCELLHDEQFVRTQRIIEWRKYWNPTKLCDYSLVDKVLG